MKTIHQHAIGIVLSVLAALAVCAFAVWFVIPTAQIEQPAKEIIEPEYVGEYMGNIARDTEIHEYINSAGNLCTVVKFYRSVSISCN